MPDTASPAPDRPLVSVVIGSYNRLPFLELAIETVRENGADLASRLIEIVVVDGGSTDGSLTWLVEQKDIVTIVQHNRGEFRGKAVPRRSWGYFMNLGFKSAQGQYILMMSDDCLLTPGSLARGVEQLQQLEAAGRKIGGGAFYFRNWPREREYYVQLTFGGKLMVNHGLFVREALEAVGLVDEDRYAFYKADGDVCLKMWEAGYEIVDCPGAYVEHFDGANRTVRKSNQETISRDREAYRQRWSGIFFEPGGPELRDKITVSFKDPHGTAARFPYVIPPLTVRIAGRARRVGRRMLKRLGGLVNA